MKKIGLIISEADIDLDKVVTLSDLRNILNAIDLKITLPISTIKAFGIEHLVKDKGDEE